MTVIAQQSVEYTAVTSNYVPYTLFSCCSLQRTYKAGKSNIMIVIIITLIIIIIVIMTSRLIVRDGPSHIRKHESHRKKQLGPLQRR